MRRRLRRQLEEALGQEHEAFPPLRKLFGKIDKEYRRADGARDSLQHALALHSGLLQRQPRGQPRHAASAKTRSAARLFDQAPFAALVCNADRKVTAWNAAAEQLFGLPSSEAVGRELSMVVFPGDDVEAARARTALRRILASGGTQRHLQSTPTRTGGPRMCEWTVVSLRDGKGREAGNAALVQERDPLRDHYARACQAAGDGIWDWDLDGERLWLSESWRAIVGAQVETEAPAEWIDRIHPEDREAVQAAIRAHLDGLFPRFESEHRLRHEDGSWRWVLARGQVARDDVGKAVRFSGSTMDVTEPWTIESRLHDALTLLPNRAHFLELVQRSFARVRRREGERLAVLLLSVDPPQALNDRLGRAAGDELLLQICARLRKCLREGDALARSGAGEFAILVEDVKDGAEAERAAEQIHGALAEPFEIQGERLAASVSIGIALIAPAYGAAEELLLDADAAMFRAQSQGRGQSVLFDGAVREGAPHLLKLEADLRQALARDEFRVHYLPIVDATTRRIGGFEALIRWAHPTLGLVAPEHFMPFAEETGLIVPIGRWLLGQASREFQGCRGKSPEPLTLNVNLSSRQLRHADLIEHIDTVLAEQGLDPQEMAFELTEDIAQQGGHAGRIVELHDRGVRLYLDDFGAGACSLNALMRLPFDCLKIDLSPFTGGSPRGKAPELVRTIVSLARSLGIGVVAEGVETAEQFGFLCEEGCSAAQGFYFSPPVDGEGARSLLERRASW
jgi:diguanylate cyclase (GGDEF)-like protein/PAS domain S-box-containing protein